MNERFGSFRDVVELWPTRELCAAEVGASPAQVSKWWQRDSIPDRWWRSVLATSRAKDSGLTADALARLASVELRA